MKCFWTDEELKKTFFITTEEYGLVSAIHRQGDKKNIIKICTTSRNYPQYLSSCIKALFVNLVKKTGIDDCFIRGIRMELSFWGN
jgi:hypothetical protein